MAHEGYFVNVATANIVADQERYAWPPGFERCLKMELLRVDGTRVIVQRNERHFGPNSAATVAQSQDSFDPSFRSIAGGFVFEPTPTTAVTDGIRIEYAGLPAAIDADGDSWHVDFPRSLDELVILDAVVACLDSENLLEGGGPRSVARMRAEWEIDWERFIDSKISGMNRIEPFNPHYGDYLFIFAFMSPALLHYLHMFVSNAV
jgi:hypothetical protein